MDLETMVLFDPIKPDMHSVNTAWDGCSHTNQCLFAAHPVWVMRPQDTRLEEGQPGYLHCQAKASPEPEVTWLRNNLMITPEVTHTKHAIHLSNFTKSLLYVCVQDLNNIKLLPTCVFFPPRMLVLSYSVMAPSGSTMWRFTMARCTAVKPELLQADCLDTLGFLSSVSNGGHLDHAFLAMVSVLRCM